MGRTKEIQMENNYKGYETIIKDCINGFISFNVMVGRYDGNSWMFQDHDLYQDVVDGLYWECLPRIYETIMDVVESNFECLKKVS